MEWNSTDLMIIVAILIATMLGFLILGSWIWFLLALLLVLIYLYLSHSRQEVSVQLQARDDAESVLLQTERLDDEEKHHETDGIDDDDHETDDKQEVDVNSYHDEQVDVQPNHHLGSVDSELNLRGLFHTVGMKGPKAAAINAFIKSNYKRPKKGTANEKWVRV